MTQTSMNVAGVDIGKAVLDLALAGSEAMLRVGNDEPGWREAIDWLHRAGVRRVGLEASGGYERGVVQALQDFGFRVHLHQPVQVRLFARLQLQRAKTDRIDARTIAAFTTLVHPERHRAGSAAQAMAEHLVFIDQLGDDIVRLKVRLEHTRELRLRGLITADLTALRTRQRRERAVLEDSVRQDRALARRLDLLLSIPGIGRPTALALLIFMPELGQIGRAQAAALIGLAPFNQDSGQRQGQRHIAGGRARPRKAVYAAALPAAFRWNPELKTIYQRLIAKGKPHKLALVACARKLLIFANTVLQRDTQWTPKIAPL